MTETPGVLPDDITKLFSSVETEDEGLVSPREVADALAAAPPAPGEPEWEEFVLSHLLPSEKDKDGYPRYHGLRRLAQKFLGPIVSSVPHTVQAAQYDAQGLLTMPAVVEWTTTFLCARPGALNGMRLTFGDVADVNNGNIDDDFRKFATATVATRAEARVCRKALGLSRCAAEEKKDLPVPVELASNNGFITDDQISLLKILCDRHRVDLQKLIRVGQTKFSSLEQVTEIAAQNMIVYMNDIQRGAKKKPDAIKQGD